MDAEGIERSILFPTTGLFFGGIEDDRAQIALCRTYNDWLGEYCEADRDRLVGIAAVPQNDLAVAAEEARRAVVEYGFVGVMVRPNPIRGRSLHHPAYEPLWKVMEERNVTICVHEGTTQNVIQAGRDRFEAFALRHACSHPLEQQMGCLSLICGGVLERHPGLALAGNGYRGIGIPDCIHSGELAANRILESQRMENREQRVVVDGPNR